MIKIRREKERTNSMIKQETLLDKIYYFMWAVMLVGTVFVMYLALGDFTESTGKGKVESIDFSSITGAPEIVGIRKAKNISDIKESNTNTNVREGISNTGETIIQGYAINTEPSNTASEVESKEASTATSKEVSEAPKSKTYAAGDVINIRCTTYYVSGTTASGEQTRQGILAGKREWLNRECNLYRTNADGSKGELIGRYVFKDTGFGIDRLNGVNYPNGTISAGASIDMWHPTEEACWDYVSQYGDYVYLEFIN